MSRLHHYIKEAISYRGSSEYGEEFYKIPRSKNITKEEAFKLIDTNCKKTMKTQKWLYRETKAWGDFVISDPTKGERYSRNTSNYLTMMMSYLPSWSKYPKRTKCLVCSTGKSGAYGYGHRGPDTKYVVIPYDKCMVGVAPSFDIFAAFGKSLTYDVPAFNGSIEKTAESLGVKINDTSWWSISSGLEKMAEKWNIAHGNLITQPITKDKGKYIEDLIMIWLSKGKKGTFMSFISEFLSPEKNNFSVYKAGESGIPTKEREAWVGGGKCILVSFDAFKENWNI